MIDTLTVVFKPELPILKVQAESISKNCQHIGIKNIFVVVNDDPQVVDLIDKTWWGPLQNCVRVLHRSALADWYVDDGWLSQQALKVLGAAYSENEFIMILDAKTIIVKPVTLDLVLPEGKPTGGNMPIPEVFDTSAKIVGHLFDVKLTKNGGSSGVPFFFHGQTIRKMIDEIHSRTGEKFSDFDSAISEIEKGLETHQFVELNETVSAVVDEQSTPESTSINALDLKSLIKQEFSATESN